MSRNWASTLRLPKSLFPPRPSAETRPLYLKRCTDELYAWQAQNRPADDKFLLHDGPPYANGSLHLGHALNKVLKDMILRVKIQQGKRVNYVPGWDCHGLPIEMKAIGASGHKSMSPTEIRQAARSLASSAVAEQLKSFKSYAVMSEWDNKWTTMDPQFEIRQLQLFQKLVRKGLIYRKYKPVYWSPSSGTALAEAELEYKENHVSKSAYVVFPIVGDPLGVTENGEDLFAITWTTTPWTLPANKALAVHDDLEYCVVKVGGSWFLVAKERLDAVTACCFKDLAVDVVLPSIKGSELKHLQYTNKLQGEKAPSQPFIHGDFVTAESGSGVVHCAPGHGFEDYEACTRLGIPVSSPVDEDGNMTSEAFPDDPEKLTPHNVLKGAGKVVLSILDDRVLHVHNYKHKYPYDWRTKQPVIVRATEQWFADVDTIKQNALDALKDITFFPEGGRNRLESFVNGRSEWCISRQRAWGVPIPALYRKDGSAVVTDESVAHIITVLQERGTDAWWSDATDDPAWVAPSLRGEELHRGMDTMDVWFDSGSSWTMLKEQADVYLEGSDQHRGWFQSSLLTRIAAQEDKSQSTAPFRTVITHGFTLDQKGKKMSKSLGNIISPDQVMDGSLLPPVKRKGQKTGTDTAGQYDALGPDALRLWVASSEYTKDVSLGKQVLDTMHKSLLKYRTTAKMFLGSMHESARSTRLSVVDHIALIRLMDVMGEVQEAYEKYQFYRAVAAINKWLANDLSAFYLEASKDRLYCGDGGGVMEELFFGFMRMLAPITPVLVEEAWDFRPEWMKRDKTLIHPLRQIYDGPILGTARPPPPFNLVATLTQTIPKIERLKALATQAIEHERREKRLGSSLEASLVVRLRHDQAGLYNELNLTCGPEVLEDILVVSGVKVVQDEWREVATKGASGMYDEVIPVIVEVKLGKEGHGGHKCPRCWKYKAQEEDELCGRCEEVVGAMDPQQLGQA
ncbi:isoleucyl-tRNA synthetase [Zalerion maritima]|uniref:Isoleucine--tRNA ligase, mitochondrial n=1 Tax=Zalerion maritima TaxID=339359 RepID=A0AAD5S4B3_9PEZI|nr:isoleucyl-tRNA synthetase [Zalerion maritima]